ncbi:hypothetical protein [Bradyrhizobium icense]|uniref:hypothetical protein n=1 Tax=Bradyrhizobium icense TaxID=1274631 RepID=UPI001F2FC65E|nr:hypothetical protein [Bradyrhizobium icense]
MQHLDRYADRRPPIRLRQFVVSFSLQPRRCIGFTEAAKLLPGLQKNETLCLVIGLD